MAEDIMTLLRQKATESRSFADRLRDEREQFTGQAMQYAAQTAPADRFSSNGVPLAPSSVLNTDQAFFRSVAGAASPYSPELEMQARDRETDILTQLAQMEEKRRLEGSGGISISDQLKALEAGYEIKDGQLVPRKTAEGEPSFYMNPKEKAEAEDKLRAEFRNELKDIDFKQMRTSYDKILSTEPTAAGDLSLIFAYMKLLDPGSVVREGEFATAEKAAGVPEQILNLYNKTISGKKLSPKQRADFRRQAAGLYNKTVERATDVVSFYNDRASQFGIDPKNIVGPAGDLRMVDLPEVEQQSSGLLDWLAKIPGVAGSSINRSVQSNQSSTKDLINKYW